MTYQRTLRRPGYFSMELTDSVRQTGALHPLAKYVTLTQHVDGFMCRWNVFSYLPHTTETSLVAT